MTVLYEYFTNNHGKIVYPSIPRQLSKVTVQSLSVDALHCLHTYNAYTYTCTCTYIITKHTYIYSDNCCHANSFMIL